MRDIAQEDIDRHTVARLTGTPLPAGVVVARFFADGGGCKLTVPGGPGAACVRGELADRSDTYATVDPDGNGIGLRFGCRIDAQTERYAAELDLFNRKIAHLTLDAEETARHRATVIRNLDERLTHSGVCLTTPRPMCGELVIRARTEPRCCPDCGCTCAACAAGHRTDGPLHAAECQGRAPDGPAQPCPRCGCTCSVCAAIHTNTIVGHATNCPIVSH